MLNNIPIANNVYEKPYVQFLGLSYDKWKF